MRTYRRLVGSRNYRTAYTVNALNQAVQRVQSGKLSMLKASKKFKVPYGTLYNKCHALHTKKAGGQLRLSAAAEDQVVKTVHHLGEWKVPLDTFDVRCMVKNYLDRQGIQDQRFSNNLPGYDWLKSFLKRHNLTTRVVDNVKPRRAEVDADAIISFFDEWETSAGTVPPENLYNYDETNVCDDPGAKTVVCKRGLKRIERKIEHSKSCVSLMFCGNASGEFLPPMVVYKSKNCYSEWTKGGPRGAIYDSTTSGWFDSRCFVRWFNEVFLVHVKDKQGTKVLLGDNLASHFTPEVIEASVANDIIFSCLIPNSTHLLQPLDVAVFRPDKIEWKRILESWRKESRARGSIPKSQFPGLLKRLYSQLKPENLVAGFKASGIFPLDRQECLKRVPDVNKDVGGETVKDIFNDSVLDILKKHCAPVTTGTRKRGKKIDVTPGKRVTVADINNNDAGPSTGTSTSAARQDDVPLPVVPDDVEMESASDSQVEPESAVGELTSDDDSDTATASDKYQVGQWVIVRYAGKRVVSYFVGQVLENVEEGVKVSFLKRQPGCQNLFKFPAKDDIDVVDDDDIVDRLPSTPPMNKREQFIIDYAKYQL